MFFGGHFAEDKKAKDAKLEDLADSQTDRVASCLGCLGA